MDKSAYLLEAVKQIKDWAIWVTGIQTGAIAILGSLLKDGVSRTLSRWAIATLVCFVLSILAAVWLVLLLPLITEQLPKLSDPDIQDIYDIPLPRVLPIPLGTMATIMHLCFVLGIICFALFVYKRATTPPS